MKKLSPESGQELLDLTYSDFLAVFDRLSAGVIVVNLRGRIIFYNDGMAKIDGLDRASVLGKTPTEVYDLTPETSMLVQCLKTRQPIIDRPFFYRTRMGRVANTIHSVYPLFKNRSLKGAVCFVREYNALEETLSRVSMPLPKSNIGNDTRYTFSCIIGSAPEFLQAVNTAMMAAGTPSPVMLYGETGTGKELFAQAIHNQSSRSKARFTAINCAAIPENLLEGILFGTSKGAFTGAQDKPGLFERTGGGTVFLDELNSMPLSLQAKILRVLQERKVRRLGSFAETCVDLKIISSVNRQPHLAISENSLRPDLFYRLGVVFIPIPPLRDRREDIESLTRHFMEKHSRSLGRNPAAFSSEVMACFRAYHWPGNVRELEHVIEGALNLVGPGDVIALDHLRSHLPTWYRMMNQSSAPDSHFSGHLPEPEADDEWPLPEASDGRDPPAARRAKSLLRTQEERERRLIAGALQAFKGNVTQAARSMGISRQLLHYKMKKHRIARSSFA
ncbi:sigma-54 interaction domain-containing protein [Desulfococcus sp.]|uniref:sigma-54 interaction domain-containing protein n=1 Tax=Desulfococcus sp. TaxID=2025834 RepID=UPI0035936079